MAQHSQDQAGTFSEISLQDNSIPALTLALPPVEASISQSVFTAVLENLIRNPNITSSHLFRADILYDSATDPSYNPTAHDPLTICALARHMQPRYRPRLLRPASADLPLRRTLVRELIPRNPDRDARLSQTCHFFGDADGDGDADGVARSRTLVLYVPHADTAAAMPWYHPRVAALAFTHDCAPGAPGGHARIAIYTAPFAQQQQSLGQDAAQAAARLHRTLLNLQATLVRHCRGRMAGYVKRVRHDAVVPQARVQNTYARLKSAHARVLSERWAESTDPSKHVFEDLLIAAFLVEVWRDMYGARPACERDETTEEEDEQRGGVSGATRFPGFVDIGCGNGLLVHVLRIEGYAGWGFDVRERKSWAGFGPATAAHLHEMTLVPSVFGARDGDGGRGDGSGRRATRVHDGLFPPGTFIISNHADELTAWTPLLAALSGSCPFLAIPCCSHDLGGSRTRFKARKRDEGLTTVESEPRRTADARPAKQPSAYATLCDYVEHVAQRVGCATQREMMRIPSTRNVGILGTWSVEKEASTVFAPSDAVRLIEEEMQVGVEQIGDLWWDRAEKIRISKGSGH